MISLSNPRTGHEIKVDDESAEFWRAAGYRDTEPAKKAPAKKSASKKSSSTKK